MSSKKSRRLVAVCAASLALTLGCDSPKPKTPAPGGGSIGGSGSSAIAATKDPLAPTVIEVPPKVKLEPAEVAPTTVVAHGEAHTVPKPTASKPVVVKEVTETIKVPHATTTTTTVVAAAPATPAKADATGTAPVIKLAPTVDVKVTTPVSSTPTKVDVKVEVSSPEVKKPMPVAVNNSVDNVRPNPGRVELGNVNVESKSGTTAQKIPEGTLGDALNSKKEEAKKEEPKKPIVVALANAKAPESAAPAAAPAEGFIPPQAMLAGKSSVAAPVIGVKKSDWNQWGGSSVRNNIPEGKNIATEWKLGDSYINDGIFKKEEASENVLWAAAVGSQTYGNPVVANGKVYVGTNNGNGWVKRFPSAVDLGCFIAFDEKDGKFLWQHSSEKLPSGRVHDWPMQGICCSPLVEGDKVWFVSSRGIVICVDSEGFHDNEDDGPITNEPVRLFDVMANDDPKLDKLAPMLVDLKAGKFPEAMRKLCAAAGEEVAAEITVEAGKRPSSFIAKYKKGEVARTLQLQMEGPKLGVYKLLNVSDKDEADVIWELDMMTTLGVSQHNMCSCSVTDAGDILFVCTSNGVDEGHITLPAPNAPSFIALDKKTGKLLWKDGSPGTNILHGQWSSPAYAVIDGTPQIIFAGGDGWLYSFKGDAGKDGKPELLWSFDANPKTSKYILGGRGTRNEIIATPVVYNDLVYLAVGQDPEHGEGIGHLWCIDPKKRGDISAELAFNLKDPTKPIPHKRMLAVDEAAGEVARPNPNSGVVWHYSQFDKDGNKKIAWEEEMHRTCGTVVIKDDLLYIADFSGLFHCVDATTGKPYWTHDLLAACWGSAMIVDGKVYVGDEEGKITIFKHSKEYEEPTECQMGNSIYTTPLVANNKLFIANKTHVFAIGSSEGGDEKKAEKKDDK